MTAYKLKYRVTDIDFYSVEFEITVKLSYSKTVPMVDVELLKQIQLDQ